MTKCVELQEIHFIPAEFSPSIRGVWTVCVMNSACAHRNRRGACMQGGAGCSPMLEGGPWEKTFGNPWFRLLQRSVRWAPLLYHQTLQPMSPHSSAHCTCFQLKLTSSSRPWCLLTEQQEELPLHTFRLFSNPTSQPEHSVPRPLVSWPFHPYGRAVPAQPSQSSFLSWLNNSCGVPK
jgi:hypothetical protein